MRREIDPGLFREVMGQYPTGVVVVTALSESGKPLGMTVGSFNSASLSPTLISFMPDQQSNSWRALRQSGQSFAVNILSADQERICRAIATRKTDKFEGIGWRLSREGNPLIDGCIAGIDCVVEEIRDAGDHHVVLGRVLDLSEVNPRDPLLFYRGGYGSFRSRSLAAGDADLLEYLQMIDVARPHMDALASDFDTQVTASCLVGGEIVLAAASGARAESEITRVGRRVRFQPPFGSVFVAWAPEPQRERWFAEMGEVSAAVRKRFLAIPRLVRGRGYGLTLVGSGPARDGWLGYNPDDDVLQDRPVESVTAPVFDQDGRVGFALTIWSGGASLGESATEVMTDQLLAATRTVTEQLGGHGPGFGADQE